jgi:hypothetical protein
MKRERWDEEGKDSGPQVNEFGLAGIHLVFDCKGHGHIAAC